MFMVNSNLISRLQKNDSSIFIDFLNNLFPINSVSVKLNNFISTIAYLKIKQINKLLYKTFNLDSSF